MTISLEQRGKTALIRNAAFLRDRTERKIRQLHPRQSFRETQTLKILAERYSERARETMDKTLRGSPRLRSKVSGNSGEDTEVFSASARQSAHSPQREEAQAGTWSRSPVHTPSAERTPARAAAPSANAEVSEALHKSGEDFPAYPRVPSI